MNNLLKTGFIMVVTMMSLSTANAQYWNTTGNTATGSEVIGTTTAQPLNLVTNGQTRVHINSNGNVGIGTTATTENFKLSVDGNIRAREVRINMDGWADYVFTDSFCLAPLDEVENYVLENKHLPGIPSETEVVENGIDVGEMQKLMMQKIEELTLYVIQLNKEIEVLKANQNTKDNDNNTETETLDSSTEIIVTPTKIIK